MPRNQPSLSLRIAQPPARPGEKADFSGLAIPPAGAVPRPDSASPEAALRELPYTLIRVLDEEGEAQGPWNPRLAPDMLRRGLAAMLRTRLLDERLLRAHRQGKTSFYMKSTGEEAIGAAQALALGRDDMCFPTYRLTSWLMARDYPLDRLVNQVFSNAQDPLQGRQLPILYSARDYGFYSLSGNLGTRIGHAVGWAMAAAYKGDMRLALAHVGEGTTAEGCFHEALTFASSFRAPAILCVANNQWAISSCAGLAAGDAPTFAAKAIGYGLPGLRVDGNDFLAVWAATEWAAERARANRGATLIELFTYRAEGHSSSDDPTRYRPREEPGQWPLGDPIARLAQHLTRLGEWDEGRHAALTEELAAQIKAAVAAAEKVGTLGQSKPGLGEMFEGVFHEPDWRVREQRQELGV